MTKWYLVYSKPRQENVAEINLDRQGYKVWLPRMQASRRRAGRWTEAIEPVFPRYLFVQLNAGGDNFSPIRFTRGVNGLVRIGMEPAVVADAVVDGLRGAADPRTGLLLPKLAELRIGDPVEITEGPFQGLQGIFLAKSGEERVLMLLDILGQANRVTLSRRQIAVVRRPGH